MSAELRLVSASGYLPRHRLEVGVESIGISGAYPGPWSRTVMGHDEDTTTLGVAAARGLGALGEPGRLVFCTSRPAYERTSNAAVVHSALRLGRGVPIFDLVGGEMASAGAIADCGVGGGLAVVADSVVGSPGSAFEATGGAAAAAFLFEETTGSGLASLLRSFSVVPRAPVRWRLPGEAADRSWSPRYAVNELAHLADSIAESMNGLRFDAVAVSCWDRRTATSLANRLGGRPITGPGGNPGFSGLADLPLLILRALGETAPGETFAAVTLGEGAAGLIFERGAVPFTRHDRSTEDLIVPYTEYLSWRGLVHRDMSGRPDPEPPSLPAVARNAAWKLGLVAQRCLACGTVLAPPGLICIGCGRVDEMTPHPLADRVATVATFTEDHLAWGFSKPVINAVVDFEGGGRLECEVTDASLAEIRIGAPVQMVLRRSHSALGVHNYVWKATPMSTETV